MLKWKLMKRSIIILICCQLLCSGTYGQESYLVLTKKSEKKEQTIKEGNKIKVYLQDGYIKGNFNIIDSISIAIEKDTILLSQIKGIEARTSATLVTGIALTVVGSALLAYGVVEKKEANENDPSSGYFSGSDPTGVGFIVLGAGMATYGLGNIVGGMNYKSAKWRYTIR
jgi:hypothetical protein